MPQDKDGNELTVKEAIEAFEPHGMDELIRTAKVYNATITYKQLGEAVKAATGIEYTAVYYWVGKLLVPIFERCVKEGLPSLTSLVVNSNGTVGKGYAAVIEANGHAVPDSLEGLDDKAASDRLECYRFYNAVGLPADGGRPTLTKAVQRARDVQRAARKEAEPTKLCTVHFIALPTTGVCDDCA